MYRVELITSLVDMANLQDEWNELWRRSVVKTPYQRWEWNYNWIVGSRQERYLYLLIARDADGNLAGIAPFKKNPVFGIFGIISFISPEVSCYTDFLLEKGNEANIISAFISFLDNISNNLAFTVKIAEPSLSIEILKMILEENSWYEKNICEYTQRLIIFVGDDYDKYLSGLSRKMRQEIRFETKKLGENFDVSFCFSEQNSNFDDDMKMLFGLNVLRWGGEEKKSHLVHRKCYRAFHRTDDVKVFSLSCDGKPVAAISALFAERTVFLEVAGFDYSFFKIDLGKVFYNYLFRWCAEHGYDQIDFSSGEEPYKFRYRPQEFAKWKIEAHRNRKIFTAILIHNFCLTQINMLKGLIIRIKDRFLRWFPKTVN